MSDCDISKRLFSTIFHKLRLVQHATDPVATVISTDATLSAIDKLEAQISNVSIIGGGAV
ncbi:hypothetical protein [Rhizobium rhizosphaerae]|uniref:hypothetical protein n=1 Tax=Xaviernesmea rhizosphaerae TaxID=1672749 RepID=UPI001117E503|nr:hypothetical protein [Xaviernesmea rhizosphaerae]